MRETLYKELSTDNDVIIYDPTTVKWTSFEWAEGYFDHIVKKTDILKSYYISYFYYGTVEYTDIILLLNNIADPFKIKDKYLFVSACPLGLLITPFLIKS